MQVFLTNTLEPIAPQPNFLLPGVTEEVKAAQAVKDKPILVITGNPPYSGHSKNNSPLVKATIEAYKQVDGKPLGEKNPKWLQDDYVKFIRFAQMKMDQVEEGVVGIITNHSWLDNPTFRGMRQSLMQSFEQIYVLDLHGNTKKKERAPDGGKDENVFDIEQGVAVSLFVKRKGLARGIWRGDLWGKRLEKYLRASEENISLIGDELESPQPPFYLFIAQDEVLKREYDTSSRLTEIMPLNVLGFQSHRDDFAISFTQKEMEEKLRDFSDPHVTNEDLLRKYGIKSNRDWSIEEARITARKAETRNLSQVDYRPFDRRWSEYSEVTMDYPRREILDHVVLRDNITLGVGRAGSAIPERPWELATVSANPLDANMYRRGGVNVFPLFLFKPAKQENLSPDFRVYLDAHFDHHYTPEEVLGFIYAVLQAPSYRKRYAEFLRIDFPRIPFPERKVDFDLLSKLGWELVQAHLLRKVPRLKLAILHGKGSDEVEAVRYSPQEKAIHFNKTQHFAPVPEDVWNFYIGGYQVLDKYLKSRKGRKLSLDEITHVSAVADSLAFTIAQMAKIDTAYKSAFPDRG